MVHLQFYPSMIQKAIFKLRSPILDRPVNLQSAPTILVLKTWVGLWPWNEEKFREKQFYYESQNAHYSQRFSHIFSLAGMVKTNPTPSGEATSGRIYFTVTAKPIM